MEHHFFIKTLIVINFLTFIHCESVENGALSPQDIENNLDKINKKTDEVKGFIEDIPKFLQSIKEIEMAEKDIADGLTSYETKVKAAQGGGNRKKRNILPQTKDNELIKIDNDETAYHVNNTASQVKAKLVEVLENFLKSIANPKDKTEDNFENDPDYKFPNIVPQSTLSETLLRYNISLQNEKNELLKLENVILKMQTIVESALLEIYSLEDELNDNTIKATTVLG